MKDYSQIGELKVTRVTPRPSSDSETIYDEAGRKKRRKKIEIFDFIKMILTQNIIDGNWTLNSQTKFLIEKEKIIFNKIEKIIKPKNFWQK